MGEKRYIPRWIYTEIMLPRRYQPAEQDYVQQRSDIKIPPDTFRNSTNWPFKLEHLTIAGLPQSMPDLMSVPWVSNLEAIDAAWWGGIGAKLDCELGISGQNINAASGLVNAVFTQTEPFTVHNQMYLNGVHTKLKHPYILSRDNALIVNWRLLYDRIRTPAISDHFRGSEEPLDTRRSLYGAMFGVLAYGVDTVTGKPVIIAGNSDSLVTNLNNGNNIINCADLQNRGVNDVAINELVFIIQSPSYSLSERDEPYYYTNQVENTVDGIARRSGFYIAYQVNPLIGQRWMQGSVPIPTALLAPNDVNGMSPRDCAATTYTFPEGTYLYRRQELDLRLRKSEFIIGDSSWGVVQDLMQSLYDRANQIVGVCLFGYLELE